MENVMVAKIRESMVKGITFAPEVDLRKDLVVGYGYSIEKVVSMSDDEVYDFFDRMEYGEQEAELHPIACSCGSKKVACIGYDHDNAPSNHYNFQCPSCKKQFYMHECSYDAYMDDYYDSLAWTCFKKDIAPTEFASFLMDNDCELSEKLEEDGKQYGIYYSTLGNIKIGYNNQTDCFEAYKKVA